MEIHEFVTFVQAFSSKQHTKDKLSIPYERFREFKAIGPYFPYLLYWPETKYLYIGPGIKSLLGYEPRHFDNGVEKLMNIAHPEDAPLISLMVKKAVAFLRQLPVKERDSITVAFDYRLMCADGRYRRFMQQVLYINMDDEGGMIYEAGVLIDVTRFGKTSPLSLCITNNSGQQLLFYVPEEDISISLRDLTQRELEIIECLDRGLTSQEISELLNVSHHTIKTHRKNILKKVGVSNTVELLKYCRDHYLIM